MDDGVTGMFSSLIGYTTNSLQTTYTVAQGVVEGIQHNFRYRARNAIGWGLYSAESTVLAASSPSAPPPPFFTGYSGGALYIAIEQSRSNGGSSAINYEL